MRTSKLFGKTLRQPPAEVELMSHNLMLRAGMIYQVSSGVYSYLPTALRSLRKIENILRDEMENAEAEELRLSVLQPKEIWERFLFRICKTKVVESRFFLTIKEPQKRLLNFLRNILILEIL